MQASTRVAFIYWTCNNIASIYGLEESRGEPALVMELVEGATLSERLQKGPIPIEETVAIARQSDGK